MSQFPHDQFAKNLLESLLSPFWLVQIAFTMSSEIREIDVYFTPDSLPTNLGLLSQCAATTETLQAQIAGLPVERLEDLAEVLLDFNTVEELSGWLDRD